MPNIRRRESQCGIDSWRRNPDQFVFTHDLAAAGVFKSYDAVKRAIEQKVIPEPYRLPGNRMAWEARALLKAFGISVVIDTEQHKAEAA